LRFLAILGGMAFNGFYLGAISSGAALYSMPGMAVGAAVGALRRPRLALACDAPQESVTLRIAVPLAIAVAIWTVWYLLAVRYLPELNRGI
jgi:mannose/fructose/N-acetylgalactosamine-specific phosphotransferase system component IIC